jgi:hypothetical protein
MTSDTTDRLLDLAAAATGVGTWKVYTNDYGGDANVYYRRGKGSEWICMAWSDETDIDEAFSPDPVQREANLVYLAAAANAVPGLVRENERLRAALWQHGRHGSTCYLNGAGNGQPCTCGLSAALAAGGEG